MLGVTDSNARRRGRFYVLLSHQVSVGCQRSILPVCVCEQAPGNLCTRAWRRSVHLPSSGRSRRGAASAVSTDTRTAPSVCAINGADLHLLASCMPTSSAHAWATIYIILSCCSDPPYSDAIQRCAVARTRVSHHTLRLDAPPLIRARARAGGGGGCGECDPGIYGHSATAV